jgi:hypothetical protein
MDRLLRMYSQLTSLLDRDRAEKENESESSFQLITAPLEYSRGTLSLIEANSAINLFR